MSQYNAFVIDTLVLESLSSPMASPFAFGEDDTSTNEVESKCFGIFNEACDHSTSKVEPLGNLLEQKQTPPIPEKDTDPKSFDDSSAQNKQLMYQLLVDPPDLWRIKGNAGDRSQVSDSTIDGKERKENDKSNYCLPAPPSLEDSIINEELEKPKLPIKEHSRESEFSSHHNKSTEKCEKVNGIGTRKKTVTKLDHVMTDQQKGGAKDDETVMVSWFEMNTFSSRVI